MDDRRQHSRQATPFVIEVSDLHSGRRLGRLVDLSEEGFMLASELPPEADTLWECRLQLDAPVEGVAEVRLGADCLWSRPGADNQHCWAGFHIIDIDDSNSAHLESLLEHL